MIWKAFIRPRTQPGITRCPATQNSDPASAQAAPASVAQVIKAGSPRIRASAKRTATNIAMEIDVIPFGEVRCLK